MSDELLDVLRKLPALSKEDHVDTIHVQLRKHHSLTLQPQDHALIAFIDDAFSEMLKQTDLDFKVESFVRDLAPHVAAIAIEENVIAITRQQPILWLLDTIIVECVGWSEDLGILGEQFMAKIAAPITKLTNGWPRSRVLRKISRSCSLKNRQSSRNAKNSFETLNW